MDKNHNERLIEYDIPLLTISEQSVREKSVRHGPLSTLHVWWAAKPQIASRAAIYASFIPKPTDQKGVEREKEFISKSFSRSS